MKHYKRILVALSLIFVSNFGFSQSNEISVKLIGNAGLHMTDGNLNIYVDFPYRSGAYGYMEYDEFEIDNIQENSIFIFTHRHADHYSKKILKKIKNKHKGNVYGNWNTKKLVNLNNALDDFKIEAFKTKHRFTFKHYSYLITWHGKKIFISGDTEKAETIASIKDMDWAFVPYWIILDAIRKELKIDAEKFGLYHLYPNQEINNTTPEKVIEMDTQGEVISIPY